MTSNIRFSMGDVSKAFLAVGLIPLVPAIILTIISLVFPTLIPETSWFNSLAIAIIVGILYAVALPIIVLGVIIAIRDSE